MRNSRQADVGSTAYSPKISPASHMAGDIRLYKSRKIRALVDLSYGGYKVKMDVSTIIGQGVNARATDSTSSQIAQQRIRFIVAVKIPFPRQRIGAEQRSKISIRRIIFRNILKVRYNIGKRTIGYLRITVLLQREDNRMIILLKFKGIIGCSCCEVGICAFLEEHILLSIDSKIYIDRNLGISGDGNCKRGRRDYLVYQVQVEQRCQL